MSKKKKTGLAGRWVQIFASGTLTSSNGTVVTITDENLQTISTLYNERVDNGTDGDRAPAIKGHTDDSSVEAWAWMSETKVEGSKLFGKFEDVVDQFETEIENKQYYNRSISLASDFSILHVAFLGAVPPAVKGMDDFSNGKNALEFSKGFNSDNETLEFSSEFLDWGIEARFNGIGRIFRGVKNHFIETLGIEKADSIISEWDIEGMKVEDWEKEDYDKTKKINYSEEPMTKEEQEAFDALKNSVSEFSGTVEVLKSNNEKLTADFSALKEENEKMKADKITIEKNGMKAEFNAIADNLVVAGKITAAVANSQKENFSTVIDAGILEFSEGDKKITTLEKHKASLSVLSGVAVVDFNEFAKKSDATNQFSQEQLDIAEGKSIADSVN